MSVVRILPEIISNRIAAGEVVERPVSIVKELIENSLDAGATRITIEIKRGGRDLVRVYDNGRGMGRDDALLAIERYATSKIISHDDLFAIKSFGFRGEALPSIASVSKFTLVTREKGADSGTRIFINGGKLMDVSHAGSPSGTDIEVKSLFFNTPVRRKFLKSVNTEMGHIADIVSGMALGNRKTGFRLFHNSRLIKSFLPSDDMLKRAGEVFGNETIKQFCRVCVKVKKLMVKGYVSAPSLTRSTSRNIRLFVNNRMISDTALVSAIFSGFKGRIMKGQFPVAVIFITLPFDEVDVNVHPAKLKVRFADQNHLYSTVSMAVHKALCDSQKKIFSTGFSTGIRKSYGMIEQAIENSPELTSDDQLEMEKYTEKIKSGLDHRNFEKKGKKEKKKIAESFLEWGNANVSTATKNSEKTKQVRQTEQIGQTGKIKHVKQIEPAFEKTIISENQKIFKFESKIPVQELEKEQVQEVEQQSKQKSDLSSEYQLPTSSFHVTGQVLGTYIVAESGDNVLLVDQHAAHERIVYEKLKKRSESFSPPSQSLIVPETLELGFREANLLEKIIDDLSSLGIIVEPFGGTSFIIKSVPSIIDDREACPFIREMLDKILESGTDTGDDIHKKKWLDDVLILMACHSSIRANYALNTIEMEKLLSDLEKCENPFNCPHGRPTRIKWSKTEIEKLFKRIV